MITEKYNYCSISRAETNGMRLYTCPDGSRVPSVTTILSQTQSPEKIKALIEWRARVGAATADAITTEAASRGSRMHRYLEDYLLTGAVPEPGSNPYSKLGNSMANTIVENGLCNLDECWGSEVSLYYPELYAGTTDAVGVHCGEPAIIDFKQSNKPKQLSYIDDYRIQVALYAMAHDFLYETEIKRGVIMICVKPAEIAPGKWGKPQYQEFVIAGDAWRDSKADACDRLDQFYKKKRMY